MEGGSSTVVAEEVGIETNNAENMTSGKKVEETNDKCLSNSGECLINGQNFEEPCIETNNTEDDSSIHSENIERCKEDDPKIVQNDPVHKEEHIVGTSEIKEPGSENIIDDNLKPLREIKVEDDSSKEQFPISSNKEDTADPFSKDPLQLENLNSDKTSGDKTSKEPAVTTTETDATVGSSPPSSISSPATASAGSDAATTISNSSVYHVKWINGSQIDKVVTDGASNMKEPNSSNQSTKVAIVTQNENGPCPLLSIVNVLLLRRKLTLPEGCEVISAEQLLEYIGGVIVDSVPNDLADSRRLDYEQNVQDAIAILPQLQTGIDVNVRFTGVSDFEYTKECIIFDLLNISLYHGWLLDPQEEDVATAIHSLSYNQLVETIIDNKNSSDHELVTQSLIASQFLEDNGSQLTYHGLCELNATLKDGELAVLFRNNHFSVMLKRRDELFLLVTDQGYLKEPNVVWETLSSVDGAGHYVDHRFVTFTPAPTIPEAIEAKENSSVLSNMASEKTVSASNQSPTQGSSNSPVAGASMDPRNFDKTGEAIHPNSSTSQIDQDLLLAMTLAEEEKQYERGTGNDHVNATQLTDEELAQRLQAEENRAAHQAQEQNERVRGNQSLLSSVNPGQPTASSSSRQVERHEPQRNKNCTIL